MPRNRRESAEGFAEDVDRILREAGKVDSRRPDADYRQDLIVAAELAGTDFSADSGGRAALRRRLLTGQTAAPHAVPERLAGWMRPWRQHPRLAAAVGATVVLLGVLVAQPTLRASVVEPAINYLKRLVLGEHTQAVVAEPFSESEMKVILAERARELEAGERWFVRTAVSTVGGDVPAGGSPVIRTYCSLALAEAAAAFTVVKPGYLPEGYAFDHAVITPGDGVVLWYSAPGKRITLYQRPVVAGRSTMAMAMGDGSSVQEVAVESRTAAWMNDHKLVWEGSGSSYDLEGDQLTLQDALEIARSLD